MKCPFCKHEDTRVIDSRTIDDGASIRRRRECPECGRRFTTYEKYEQVPLLVIKKDGRREMFDNKKILAGLLRAFEKRPFTYDQIQGLAAKIEAEVRATGENEIKSSQIGEKVMEHLEKIDQIAYVRFASVYRQFADVNSFMQEIQNMLKKNNGAEK